MNWGGREFADVKICKFAKAEAPTEKRKRMARKVKSRTKKKTVWGMHSDMDKV